MLEHTIHINEILSFLVGILFYFLYKYYKNNKNKIGLILFTEKSFKEQLDRNYKFFGDEGMMKIRNSHLLVYGNPLIIFNVLVTLVRSGVSKISSFTNEKMTNENKLFQKLSSTTLPYIFFSTYEDIGMPIYSIFENYIKKINPKVEINLIENINDIYLSKCDYFVDSEKCFENNEISMKILKYCEDNNKYFLKIINWDDRDKLDNEGNNEKNNQKLYDNLSDKDEIRIGSNTLSMANNEYAKKLYDSLNKTYMQLFKSSLPEINCVYNNSLNGSNNNSIILYSLLSQSAASKILCQLADFTEIENKQHENPNSKSNDQEIKINNKPLKEMIEEYKKFEEKHNVKINMNFKTFFDICKIFSNKSAISEELEPKQKFVRWRCYKEPNNDNIVLMGKSEMNKHLNIHSEEELINFYGKEIVDRIDKKLSNLNLKD